MRNKLMLDIETTGQAPGCRVLSFAAFGFSAFFNMMNACIQF